MSDFKVLWSQCCNEEGVRFVKKGSKEYDRVKERYRKKVITSSVHKSNVENQIRRMDDYKNM
jgi:hypothetical protein